MVIKYRLPDKQWEIARKFDLDDYEMLSLKKYCDNSGRTMSADGLRKWLYWLRVTRRLKVKSDLQTMP